MPETPQSKIRPHPVHAPAEAARPPAPTAPSLRRPTRYAELHTLSNFSFLRGGSHPDELVACAAELGYSALAITDCNTLAGIVRAHVAAKERGLKLAVGCRLELTDQDGLSLLVYPTDRDSYGRLCRLLTAGKRRVIGGECRLTAQDVIEHSQGMLAVLLPPPRPDEAYAEAARGLRGVFGDDRLSIAIGRDYSAGERARIRRHAALSKDLGIPLAATNAVHFHGPERRPLQDVLTCIRLGCTLDAAGFRLHANAERYLKPPEEIARLLSPYPGAVARAADIAERAAGFSLDELRYEYPDEVVPPGATPGGHLAELAWAGAAWRYPDGVPAKVRAQIEHELRMIDELHYAPYFLTVHDLVVYARSLGILCQGRGSAANSAVCYCLGVTAVDPGRIDVLFERFVSRERNEPPDIDIDFEHERREEVIQYIYRKYGRDRAALTAEVITYRGRSAVREVGKALGLSLDCVDRLAKSIDWWDPAGPDAERLRELGLDPADPTLARVAALTREILGFPRHLSQHVGGFVITRRPLCEMVPVKNAAMEDRTVIEWDKDDINAMGMLKVDVLGLGMLTCIRKGFELVERHHGRPLTLATVPPEDPAVYDMLCRADTVGVFQIESRAQMSMLPRLRPRCFYDLVIEVAIVRPGPIQGNMVHPYLRRRDGLEPVNYPSEDVRKVLGKTLGIPLFQEQAMQLAIVAAGFTPGEADQLRRAMAAWKRKGDQIYRFGQKLVAGMVERGYDPVFAHNCFEQVKGFSEYGFPESHAASFALLVYISSWLKRHHPAAFAAALLNSQPMGFYAPAQIVRDAREHGVMVLPVDAGSSLWDCTLEENPDGPPALRLGMRLIKGLREEDASAIAAAAARASRGVGPPLSTLEALWDASGVGIAAIRRLAAADAFRSLGLDRQAALWQARELRDADLPMFPAAARTAPPRPALPPVPPVKEVVRDYATVGLSLKAHPMSFLREELDRRGAVPAGELADEGRYPSGTRVRIAGVVLVRQRPSTAKGIVFMTIEDETGPANLVIRPPVYKRCRRAARHSVIILVHGVLERRGEVVHIIVRRIEPMELEQDALDLRSRDFH